MRRKIVERSVNLFPRLPNLRHAQVITRFNVSGDSHRRQRLRHAARVKLNELSRGRSNGTLDPDAVRVVKSWRPGGLKAARRRMDHYVTMLRRLQSGRASVRDGQTPRCE